MKKENKDLLLKQLFQTHRKKDKLVTPSFSKTFRKAQQKNQSMKRTKFSLMVACIAVLTVIGFAINEDTMPVDLDKITIAKGSSNLYARLIADGEIVTNDIHFEFNKAILKPGSFTIIKEVVEMLENHPEVQLNIEGHTDSHGSGTYNQTLSEKRAASVMASIIKSGIAANRLTSEGLGESKPLNENKTDEERALNRRVVFVQVK